MQEDLIVAYVSDDEEEEEWTGAYHPLFPNDWASSHEHGTGPEQCNNCATYGSYDGQFIGYCANCAIYVYHGSRGRGFVDEGTELVNDETRQWISVFDTYLHQVEFARFHVVPPALGEPAYDDVPVVSDDEDDEFDDNVEFTGQDTVFEAHYEGGYADF
jgi:hypothetical protein